MAKNDSQFEGQHHDESVILVFRRHPVVMRKGLIVLLLGVALGAIPTLINPVPSSLWFMPLGLLLAFPFFWVSWVKWYFSVFIVTDQRLLEISQKGLFSRSVVDIGLDKIQNVNYQVNGLQETLLGFGTIMIQTFVGDMLIENVQKPAKIQHDLVKIIKELGISELNA